jgi:hypothetical protein
MSNRIILSGLARGFVCQRNVPQHTAANRPVQGPFHSSLDSHAKSGKVSPMKKLTILVAACLACIASAATLQILTLDEMTGAASAVVQGRIVASRSDWINGKGSQIYTFYTVQAESYLKGNLGSSFQLTEPGGNVGILNGSVPGAPAFQVGEQVVLFVQTDGRFHQAIGYEQGVFRMHRDPASGALTVNHSQPLAKGGQIVASDEVGSLVAGARTSRDLTQFLSQIGDSIRRVKKGVQ